MSVSVKRLTFCAISIALASIAGLIKLYSFPFGGAVTFFSMLFITLPSWLYGVRYGSLCGLCYGIIQFILNPFFISPLQVILDYVLAFTVMGTAGFFKDSKNGIVKGYMTAIFARWIIAVLAGLAWVSSGSVAWKGWAPLPYSMAYNGIYIFTEAALTVVVLLIPAVGNALKKLKQQSE